MVDTETGEFTEKIAAESGYILPCLDGLPSGYI